jgi:hypothetical protein
MYNYLYLHSYIFIHIYIYIYMFIYIYISTPIYRSAGKATFFGPRGVTVDEYGYIFVADTLNNAIRMIRPDGIIYIICIYVHAYAFMYIYI